MPLDSIPQPPRSAPEASHGPPFRWGQAVAVVGALLLCGIGIGMLVDARADDEPEVELGADGKPMDERAKWRRDRANRARAARPDVDLDALEQAFAGAGPGFYGDGNVGLEEARDHFDGTIEHLEKLAARRRPLRQKQWDVAHQAANDSFVTLETKLDVKNDRKHRAEFEEAHKRLKGALAALRVRGGKFRVR